MTAGNTEETLPALTVLVCTHNPREEFLQRALEALKRQALPLDQWELLLIDNASSPPIRDRHDISWHTSGRYLTTTTLGKTHAISDGIRAARSDLLVIVDDDNILHPDYLNSALKLFRNMPFLGVVCGAVLGEYECAPQAWVEPYLPFLAIGNQGNRVLYAFTPDRLLISAGAGMVIRKTVAERYLREISDSPIRKSLDPVGNRLSRSGDIDMALCAFDEGFAKGYSPDLVLTHLISAKRLRLSYIKELRSEGEFCDTILALVRGSKIPNIYATFIRSCIAIARRSAAAHSFLWQQFAIELSILRGRKRAIKYLQNYHGNR